MQATFDLSTLTEKQLKGLRLLNDDKFTRIQFEGGSRSGKTFVICAWIILRALAYSGSQHLVARFVRVKAKGTIWKQTLLPMGLKLEKLGWAKINYSDLRIDFTNGSYIVVDGLEPTRIDGVLGAEYATIFVNECNENKWATIEQLFSRLTQKVFRAKDKKPIIPKFLTDLNPTTKTSWHYKLFHLKQDPTSKTPRKDADKIARLHFEPKDNIANQSDGYIESLESGSEQFRQRFLKGLYGSFEGLVYPEFSEDIHIVDEFKIPEGHRPGNIVLGRAIDFGFWPDPFVCLWFCYEIAKGRVTIYREWYQHKIIVREHAKIIYQMSYDDLTQSQKESAQIPRSDFEDTDDFYRLVKKGRFRHIQDLYDFTVCDHDSEDRETLHAAAIMTIPADKRRLIGFEHVTEMFTYSEHKRPMLYIDRSCTNTITELESYRWATDKDDERKKKDRATSAGDDHCFVAGTKILTEEGLKNIEQISTSDRVWTPFGWSKVFGCWWTANQEVKDYGAFKSTPQHKIPTTAGIKTVDSIRYGDKILEWQEQKPWSTMEFLTGVIRNRKTEMMRFILDGLLTKNLGARLAFFTATNGSQNGGRFPKAFMFTTKMAIQGIMLLAILSFSLPEIMFDIILSATSKKLLSIWRRFVPSLQSGIDQEKESNGIKSMRENTPSGIFQKLMRFVGSAEKNIKRPSLIEANSVISIAEQKPCERADVYNLTTEHGMYFANGILVCNCMDALRYGMMKMIPPSRGDLNIILGKIY